MESVLCLTDYTNNSTQTFRFALQIAQVLHIELLLVHVIDTPSATFEEEEILISGNSGAANPKYITELQRLKAFAADHGGDALGQAAIRYFVSGGSARERALELIQAHNVVLTVMGMRNRKGFADRIFGTLARKMIDQAPCPLLLIPPETGFRIIRGIAYSTDFSYDNLNAIELLLRWCDAFDAPLYLLHFSGVREEHSRAEAMMERIVHTFDEEYHKKRISFSVQEGGVIEGIERFIAGNPVDIVAMTRHSKGLWEKWTETSLAKNLAESVPVPVLIFKE